MCSKSSIIIFFHSIDHLTRISIWLARKCSFLIDFQGNDYFGQGFWYEAAHFYTKSLDVCPLIYTYDRLLYFVVLISK